MRTLNARMWGHRRNGSGLEDRATNDPLSLGGCGRAVSGESRVPIVDHDGAWRPVGLATCDNALLCDFCGPRVQAESRDRFTWHFEDWVAGGGQLLHLRLSVGHDCHDLLTDLLDTLSKGFTVMRKSPEWRAAGVVDWVRVLHLRWSPKRGWYPHYHVTGFVRPGVVVDEGVIERLQAAWRDSLFKIGFGRVSKRHGLFGRMFGSSMRALYAWSWADHDDDHSDYEPEHAPELQGPTYEPDHDLNPDHGTMALWQIAEAALGGDQRAWRVWEEACRSLKGKRVVLASKMLNQLWKEHQAEQPTEVDATLELEPVAMVDSRLWEKVRRVGLTQMGLAVGHTHGVRGLAQWWASQLGVPVEVGWAEHGPPLLSAPDLFVSA